MRRIYLKASVTYPVNETVYRGYTESSAKAALEAALRRVSAASHGRAEGEIRHRCLGDGRRDAMGLSHSATASRGRLMYPNANGQGWHFEGEIADQP